jgi:hypothetical protein
MVAASTLSAKKKRANRLNARKSTGPRTPAGKARSSQNARTHGMFCQDAVLEHENHDDFNYIRRQFIEALRPQDLLQLSFVERVAEGNWRLMRLASEERAMQQLGRGETDELLGGAVAMAMMGGSSRSSASLLNSFCRRGDLGPDPLGPARQRVEQSIGRALRELRMLQSPSKPADLPPSPYLAAEDEDDVAVEDENPQNEPTEAAAAASSGPAEGCDATASAPSAECHPEGTPEGSGEGGQMLRSTSA